MKKIFWPLLLCSFMISVHAQDTLKVQPFPPQDEQRLQEIDIRELPESIKQKLSSQYYSSWILQAAYKTPVKPGGTIESDAFDYIIELKKDEEVIRVRFANAGNRREDDDRQ